MKVLLDEIPIEKVVNTTKREHASVHAAIST